MNQENREINLRVQRVLTDYNKHLSRATDMDCIVFFFFFFEEELSDDSDQIYARWIMLI